MLVSQEFDFTLKSLLGNLTLKDFVKNYWESEVLVTHRECKTYFSDLLTMEDVDQVLDLCKPELDKVKVVKPSGFLSYDKFFNPDGNININLLYKHYSEGYSIILRRIENYWEPIKKLCFNLREVMSHHVQANMYLTPKNSVAFTPHIDDHDVLVLQIAGSKNWQLYDSFYETPLLESNGASSLNKEHLKGLKELVLNAGDVMYIPRGVPHNAFTTNDSSLHLTIGIYPVQWVDLFKDILNGIAVQDVAYRKALPFGYMYQQNIEEYLKEKTKELLSKSLDKVQVSPSIEVFQNRLKIIQTPVEYGHFCQLDKVDDINLDTRLVKRSTIKCTIQRINENFVRLIYNGNTIKGPAKIKPAFEYVSNVDEVFTPSSLPISNPAHQLKLCRRFVKGGLLQIID